MKRHLRYLIFSIILIGYTTKSPALSYAQKKAQQAELDRVINSICQKQLEAKLKEILDKHPEELKKIIDQQANLSVTRATYALLKLQERFNKHLDKVKKSESKASKKSDSEEEEDEQKESAQKAQALISMEQELKGSFKAQESDANTKAVLDYFKYVKALEDSHGLSRGDGSVDRLMKSLKKITAVNHPDKRIEDNDIFIIERLMEYAGASSSLEATKNQPIYEQAFAKLRETFQSRGALVTSDIATNDDILRGTMKAYKDAKKKLQVIVKKEMEEFVNSFSFNLPEEEQMGAKGKHNCRSYYRKLKSKNQQDEDQACLGSALRGLLSTNTPLRPFEDLLDFLAGQSDENPFNADDVNLLDHARTMYTDLLSCKISKSPQGGCAQVSVKMQMEHLPGEHDSHAEWFLHKGKLDSTSDSQISMLDSKRHYFKQAGDVAVTHKGRIHHHGPLTKVVTLCTYEDTLTLFGTRSLASEPMKMSTLYLKDRFPSIKTRALKDMKGDGTNCSINEQGVISGDLKSCQKDQKAQEVLHQGNNRQIDLLESCQGAALLEGLKGRGLVIEEVPPRKKTSITLIGKIKPTDVLSGQWEWSCPADFINCSSKAKAGKVSGKKQVFIRKYTPYNVSLIYTMPTGEQLTATHEVPPSQGPKLFIEKIKTEEAISYVKILPFEVNPSEPTPKGLYEWHCINQDGQQFKCPFGKGKFTPYGPEKETPFKLLEGKPYNVYATFKEIKEKEEITSNQVMIDSYSIAIDVKADPKELPDKVPVTATLTIEGPKSADIKGKQYWSCKGFKDQKALQACSLEWESGRPQDFERLKEDYFVTAHFLREGTKIPIDSKDILVKKLAASDDKKKPCEYHLTVTEEDKDKKMYYVANVTKDGCQEEAVALDEGTVTWKWKCPDSDEENSQTGPTLTVSKKKETCKGEVHFIPNDKEIQPPPAQDFTIPSIGCEHPDPLSEKCPDDEKEDEVSDNPPLPPLRRAAPTSGPLPQMPQQMIPPPPRPGVIGGFR